MGEDDILAHVTVYCKSSAKNIYIHNKPSAAHINTHGKSCAEHVLNFSEPICAKNGFDVEAGLLTVVH